MLQREWGARMKSRPTRTGPAPRPCYRPRRVPEYQTVRTGPPGPTDAAEGGPYSYCKAASTFSRAARRAGAIAASMPARIAAITNTINVPIGIVNAA